MKVRHSVLSLILCLSLLTPLASASVSPQPIQAGGSGINVPVVGTVVGGTIDAVFTLTRFAVQNGQLVAVGRLAGTITNTATGVVTSFIRNIVLSVTNISATCEILHLELGPLDLNLLGLMVHLDRIVLDITAEPGPGNLLGNLLCAIANLLNGNAGLNAIANLLNQILRAL
ncbi:MAG TPA: hypothetical protein VF131_22505 [Blastocatellia bacterium]|nr:hypothetical protein [Blastocatellia bacterium]